MDFIGFGFMIDTVILIVGFLCAGLVYSLCVIEYGFLTRQHVLLSVVRKYVHQGPALNTIVLVLVILSAAASSAVSNHLNEPLNTASISSEVSSASTAALSVIEE